MKILQQYLAVGGAGFLGAIARLFLGTLCGRLIATNFPLGTLVINLSGSFFLGWLSTRIFTSDVTRIALMTGFVGAYTTFSTFMFESDGLLKEGSTWMAGTNLIGSLVLGLIAIRLGILAGGH